MCRGLFLEVERLGRILAWLMLGPGLWAAPSTLQLILVVQSPPPTVGDVRDMGSIPGSGSSPGGGNGNPLQYSCLENPMDGGAW